MNDPASERASCSPSPEVLHDDRRDWLATTGTFDRSIELSGSRSLPPLLKESPMKFTLKSLPTFCLCGAVTAAGLLLNTSYAGPGNDGPGRRGPAARAQGPRMIHRNRGEHGHAGPNHQMVPPKFRGEIGQEIKAKLDTNSDGKLDAAERSAAHEKFQTKKAEKKAKVMSKFDVNKDGSLDQQERAAAHEGHKARKAEFKSRHDADQNGRLSPKERRSAKQEIIKRIRTTD
jgi:hypothetical protein